MTGTLEFLLNIWIKTAIINYTLSKNEYSFLYCLLNSRYFELNLEDFQASLKKLLGFISYDTSKRMGRKGMLISLVLNLFKEIKLLNLVVRKHDL